MKLRFETLPRVQRIVRWVAPQVFGAAALATFGLWRVLLFGEVPLGSPSWAIVDPAPSTVVFVPAAEILRSIFQKGHSVLWSALQDYGVPTLYMDLQGSLLHPWSWIRQMFPHPLRWQLNAWLELFFIAWGMFAMGRKVFAFGWPGTLTLATLGTLNTFLLTRVNHVYLLVYASAIWTLYFFFRLAQIVESDEPPWAAVIGMGLCASLSVLAGFPEAFFPIPLIMIFAFASMFFELPARLLLRIAALSLVAVGLSLLLSSVQTLGFLEGLGQTGTGFRHRLGDGYLDLQEFTALFFRFGPVKQRLTYTMGICAFFLVSLALSTRTYQRTRFYLRTTLLVAGAFFVVHAFRFIPLLHSFIGSLPVFNVSHFTSYFPPLLILCVSWLAASVVEILCGPLSGLFSPRRVAWCSAGSIFLIIGCYFAHPSRFEITGLWILLLFSIQCLLVFRKTGKFPWPSRHGLVAVVTLCFALEVLIALQGPRYNSPAVDEETQFGRYSGVIEQRVCSQLDVGMYRLMPGDFWTPKNFCVAIPDIIWAATPLVRNEVLKTLLFDQPEPVFSPKWTHSFSFMNVRWLSVRTADLHWLRKTSSLRLLEIRPDWLLFENLAALPRSYLTRRCKVVRSIEAASAAIGSEHFRIGEAHIETLDPRLERECRVAREVEGAVKIVPISKDSGALVDLEPVEGPGILVLHDTYYPGWRATDLKSGVSLPVMATNIAFRGVHLPEKKVYQIRWEYHPPWLEWGQALTVMGAILLIILTGLAVRAVRKRDENAVEPRQL